MIRRFLSVLAATLAAFLLSSAAHAADLTVSVFDESNRPVADAVVILDAPSAAKPRPTTFTINQKDMQFLPFVLVIPVGSTVNFGNLDPFRHHVYSFSPARKFELRLFGQGEVRPVKFDTVGAVAIGCNIHDSMQAFVQVVDTQFAAKSAANGRVTFREVPAGNFKLRVWHPRLRAPGNQLILNVNTSKDATVPVSVKLRKPAPMLRKY
ncbi:MAG: methylamine utilization protein [Proteobacteria bacterium]|nr:methylamine utilization protein [Pseudomonadota bacterium]